MKSITEPPCIGIPAASELMVPPEFSSAAGTDMSAAFIFS